MLFLVALLWKRLPFEALLFESRVVQPLPGAHVSYVLLDPAYAAEIISASMQAWKMSAFGGVTDNDITLEGINPYEPLGAARFLEQGKIYPGSWSPGDISPLAQALPDLVYSRGESGNYNEKPADVPGQGVRSTMDGVLEEAGFRFPVKQLASLKGSGTCRALVETGEDGSVCHVLILEAVDKASAAEIERALYRGNAGRAVSGEIRLVWRSVAK